MQTDAQKLVVVRDQFALKGLSDDALKQILPAYKEAIERLQFLLRTMPPEGSIERELWLKTQLATIEAQFKPVADRIYQVLPEAQARAFEEGLTNARKYLEAGGIRPEPAAATTTLPSATTGLNVTSAVEKGFISPSITRQQIVAAARETGFSVLSPGGSKVGLADLLPKWMAAEADQVTKHLRTGFLRGRTNEEIMREIGPLGPGRKGWAMTDAVVRTSMAEASQSAHDAFYKANEDLLIPTKSGYQWWWDASNDTRLCTICAPLDGIKFKERDQPPHPWPAHLKCRCSILPWTATQELMEKRDGPAKGSFLEATPVQYDKRVKKLPPPAGYTGDNAYKRPMKIDGQQQWVRRRDLGPGQTTAGDMLQNANEHSKRLVLGKHTEAFNKLTGKGGKYEKNPQGAVRELLGNGLPPGATPPRPKRGPKPKPPAPKPKTPTYTEKEKARIKEETNERLRARAAARAAAEAPPAPKPATPKPAPKQKAPAVIPGRQFAEEHQFHNGKLKLTSKGVADSLDVFAKEDGLVGENMRKLLAFQENKNISVMWSNGREKGFADFNHWKTPKVVSSLRDAAARGHGAVRMATDMANDLEKGSTPIWLGKVGRVKGGNAGHTMDGGGFIAIKQEAQHVVITPKNKNGLIDAAKASIKASQEGKLKYITSSDTYVDVGRTRKTKEGWLNTYIHEMGHQVHYSAGKPSIREYLPEEIRKRAGGTGPDAVKAIGELRELTWQPSTYGNSNELERFAETFTQFVLAPDELRRASPAAYRWVEEAIRKAMK